jgi:tRNA threonylcarbamoyladenosine biosynthesis protein TsaE
MTAKKETSDRREPAPAEARGAGQPHTLYSLSEHETFEIGRAFARHLEGGELVLLIGDLGLGKTVFARGLATGLGVAPEDVTSPSFTLVQEYRGGRLLLFHIDLYRIQESADTESIGLEEILSAGAVAVVEWGDRLAPYWQRDALVVRFHEVGEGSRRIELVPPRRASTPPGDA